MGGGGGDWGATARDIKRLEDIAGASLRKGSAPERRSIFISFASEDLNHVNLLRAQARKEDSQLEFIDRSVKEPFNSKNVEYIKAGIRERIRQSSVTVVYLSGNTQSSDWVSWEVEESIDQGKGVVAVYSGDSPPVSLPPAIKKHRIKIVPWEHTKLMAAITKAAKKRSQ